MDAGHGNVLTPIDRDGNENAVYENAARGKRDPGELPTLSDDELKQATLFSGHRWHLDKDGYLVNEVGEYLSFQA